MAENDRWVDIALDHLNMCLELDALGGVAWRMAEDSMLVVAPSLVEMIGGSTDGEEVFSFFSFDICEFVKVFDKLPAINWSTRDASVMIEGKINGHEVLIDVRSQPFSDATPHYNLYSDGSLGEK